jgi:flavin reductase (DIM6/NTAB) family NADH-FMN oxidoreductase RutF
MRSFTQPLKVIAKFGRAESRDVTYKHVFLGYKPLIIGFCFSSDSARDCDECVLDFLPELFPDKPVATLSMKLIHKFDAPEGVIGLYEGVSGHHSFISSFHQFLLSFRERFRKDAAGNVALHGNLYDQVRIAYSIPRTISLITVMQEDLVNVFPTDLHGAMSDRLYISSLRINGRATEQVERANEIVISEIDSSFFREVYRLGKNHMREPVTTDNFNWSSRRSKKFRYPLPEGTIQYREVTRKDSFDIGIHRVHLYEIASHETIREGNTLAHIHQYFAEWRMRHQIETEMLFR